MISVLRGTVDRDLEFNVKGFSAFADKLIAHKKYTCECCGFKSERYMRLVSLNGVYSILKPEHFIVCCPFCFLQRRLERAKDKAVMIYLPELTQQQVNMITHSLWHFSSSKSLNSTQYHYSNDTYNNIFKRTEPVDIALGDKAHLPENFAFALKSLSDEEYKLRETVFSSIRVLPIRKGFTSEIDYWSKDIYPKIAGESVEQWNALSSIMKRAVPNVQLPD
jgi:intracellular multiplication protein IcmJ